MIKEKIEEVLAADPKPPEHFLGTFYYADLNQEEQDMLDSWDENGNEESSVIDGVLFKLYIFPE